jgi:hypothetical protein
MNIPSDKAYKTLVFGGASILIIGAGLVVQNIKFREEKLMQVISIMGKDAQRLKIYELTKPVERKFFISKENYEKLPDKKMLRDYQEDPSEAGFSFLDRFIREMPRKYHLALLMSQPLEMKQSSNLSKKQMDKYGDAINYFDRDSGWYVLSVIFGAVCCIVGYGMVERGYIKWKQVEDI